MPLWEGRVIAWFSCGAASTVAAWLTVKKHGDRCIIVNEDMRKDEHEDNQRVLADTERWLDRRIIRIRSEKYSSVDEVFVGERYMSGTKGARCSTEMKKIPGRRFSDVADIHCWGYTVDEPDRIERFLNANPEMYCEFPLREAGLTKADCFQILKENGQRPSELYGLGFNNANCFGCVKSSSAPYWNRTRRVRPDVFELRARRSRELGVKLVQITINGVRERIFLDELTPEMGAQDPEPSISCGPYCEQPEEVLI